MEAYAGGRQKTHQDNFDDLDLDGPESRARGNAGNQRERLEEEGFELDDSDLRHKLITPLGQQKKGPNIKINLHTNSRKLAEPPINPLTLSQAPFYGQTPFPQMNPGFLPIVHSLPPPGFAPLSMPFAPPAFPPRPVAVPQPVPVQKPVEKPKVEQKKDPAVEKAKFQQDMKKLLSLEIFYGDGPDRLTYRGALFRKPLGKPNSKQINCHVCKLNVMEKDLINHAQGKKHASKMEGVTIIDYKKEQGVNKNDPDTRQMPITPGQPIPPGFEKVLRRTPLCQSMLDVFEDAPLIGLEYLVELLDSEDENCHVICFLCDKRGESFMQNVRQNIISHMIGTTHRMNFLKRHFPRAHGALQLVQNDKLLKMELGRYVRAIVGSIEKEYGRMKPMLVDSGSFRERCTEYRERIETAKHFCELPGKTFEECIQIPKRPPSVESLSPERSPRWKERGAVRRGRSPVQASRGPAGHWNPSPERGRSPGRSRSAERKRSPVRRRGQSYRTWKNESQSPEGGSSRMSPFDDRRNANVGPVAARDATPILDEESGIEIIEILQNSKDDGKKLNLKDALRDTTPVSNSVSPISLSPISDAGAGSRRHRHAFRNSPPRIDHFGRELTRRHGVKRSRSPEGKHAYHGRRSPRRRRKSLSCSPVSSRSGSGSPQPDSWSHSSRPVGIREKWEKFRRESEGIERDIKKKRRYYHTQPEKHPAYNGEWKVFWNKKQLEVKSSGRDPTKYDYTPEWKVYWNRRVEELYTQEYQERKAEMKKSFGFTEEDEGRRDRSIKPKSRSSKGGSNSKGGSVSDIRDTWKAMTGSDIKEEMKPLKKPEHLTMLGVLRHLTALEIQLGSLGPTINKLLGKAISMEKVKEGSSEELLLDIENTVLLETIKEKFRGQLMAGIVERFNVHGTRSAVADLTTVLDEAPPPIIKEKIQKAEEAPKAAAVSSIINSNVLEPKKLSPVPAVATPKEVEAVKVPGVGNIDRAAIAMQIANALLAQGKTDVTNEELAQLVEAVVGMAQKQSAEEKELEKKEEERKKEAEKIAKMEEMVLATTPEVNPSDMSEDDLISCLKIFEFLPEHEKHSIIMQLQRLEETNPEKVKELRKYVNASTDMSKSPKQLFGGKIDSEDDDYLDSDVLKAAKQNVDLQQTSKVKAADSKTVAEATDSMMANLKDRLPVRIMEPISTELPLPPIGALNTPQMPLPAASLTPSQLYGLDPNQQFNPYQQQQPQQFQQYGNQPYNYYQPRSNWPPVTQMRPGPDSNLISVPLQTFCSIPAVVPSGLQADNYKRTAHGTSSTLVHLVGKR